jgi:branched-chain amino acid transport system ATP-binding protein
MAETVLSVQGLKVAYGGIQAVKGVDLEVRAGELIALIGANGAGKTTTLKAITGTLAPRDGDIVFQGRSIRGQGSHELVSQGLAMVPEGRGVFARMSIVENLQMGAYTRTDRDGVQDDIEKMFAMARALMSRPRLLLLDEPSMGLSPIMVEKIFEVIRTVSGQGMTLLLVEQNAKLALEAADRCYVMDSGVVTMSGDAKRMLDDPRVRAAYLGEAA